MRSTARKSSRADGRGHWTAGKRRHEDAGGWAEVLEQIGRLAELFPGRRRHGASQAALARDLGVARKTIWRWLAEIDRPDPAMQRAVREWLGQLRRHAEKRRRGEEER
jgi:DNA-binding XRE family transcriptional regulator